MDAATDATATATGIRLRQASGSTAAPVHTSPHGTSGREAGGESGSRWTATAQEKITVAAAAVIHASPRRGMIRDSIRRRYAPEPLPPVLRWKVLPGARLRPEEYAAANGRGRPAA